jgi:hypothetical protein
MKEALPLYDFSCTLMIRFRFFALYIGMDRVQNLVAWLCRTVLDLAVWAQVLQPLSCATMLREKAGICRTRKAAAALLPYL